MNIPFRVVSRLFQLVSWRKVERFECDLDSPEDAQKETLKRIWASLETPVSIDHFSSIEPSDYADYRGRLERLTKEKVSVFETTSGSSGKKKRVPYNPSLLNSFRSMFQLWVCDLLRTQDFESGKIFMSISPRIGSKSDGFEDDSQYLGWFQRLTMRSFLAVHPNRSRARTSEEFFENVALDLLKARDLEIVTIWSPSYFVSILDFIDENRIRFSLMSSLAPEVRAILASPRIDWESLWPQLKLVSCWNHASALSSANELHALLPSVRIQGKGLLATESPVSIPWSPAGDRCVPLVSEIFFEFIDSEGRILPIHDVQDGLTYELLVTTPGGLLRYRLGDLVRIDGFYRRTPCLKFVGRVGQSSDLVGEKLSDSLVRETLGAISARSISLLIPITEGGNRGYALLTDDKTTRAAEVERALCSVHHYELARQLKQLEEVRVTYVSDLREKLYAFFESEGIQRGDLKDRALLPSIEQSRRLLQFLSERTSSERTSPSLEFS
jgi:hypothetical protein